MRMNEVRYCVLRDKEAAMDALIVHVVFDPATDTYKLGNNSNHKEVEATLIRFSLCSDPRQAKDIPNVMAW